MQVIKMPRSPSFKDALGNALLGALQEHQKRQAIQQRYSDLRSILQAFGGGQEIPAVTPQTKAGLNLYTQLAGQRMQPKESPSFERGKPYVNAEGKRVVPIYQNGRLVGQRTLGKAKTEKPEYETITFYDKNGNKRKKRVLASNYNEEVNKIIRKGGSLEEPAEAEAPEAEEAELQKYRKIRNYQQGIETILDKHGIPSEGLTDIIAMVGGNAQVNPEAYNQFVKTKYQALKQKAETDPDAREDLRKVDWYIDQITKIVGTPPQNERGREPSPNVPENYSIWDFTREQGLQQRKR